MKLFIDTNIFVEYFEQRFQFELHSMPKTLNPQFLYILH